MSTNTWSPTFALSLALLASVVIACAEKGPTDIDSSPLTGLQRGAGTDSAGGTPPAPPPADSTIGFFRGTVLGPSAPGAGNDSMATAPRIANAKVTAYPRLKSTTDTLGVGPAAAQVVTGADGTFQLPMLPGGEYIVTINPPEGSPYGGVWVTATAHSLSHQFPWWVVLWKK